MPNESISLAKLMDKGPNITTLEKPFFSHRLKSDRGCAVLLYLTIGDFVNGRRARVQWGGHHTKRLLVSLPFIFKMADLPTINMYPGEGAGLPFTKLSIVETLRNTPLNPVARADSSIVCALSAAFCAAPTEAVERSPTSSLDCLAPCFAPLCDTSPHCPAQSAQSRSVPDKQVESPSQAVCRRAMCEPYLARQQTSLF